MSMRYLLTDWNDSSLFIAGLDHRPILKLFGLVTNKSVATLHFAMGQSTLKLLILETA